MIMKNINITEQKQIALDILIHFAKYCEEHSLKYFLAYGTLIGAIRHKGYIPWDDDIDVQMPREDYEWFIHNFKGHPFYKVMTNDINPNYGKLFAVLNDTRTIKGERLYRKRCVGTVCINIDIFPVDILPDNKQDQLKLLSDVRSIEDKLACLTYAYGKGRTFLSTIRKNIGICIYRTLETLGIVTTDSLVNQHNALIAQHKHTLTHTAGCIANTGFNGIKEFLPSICFDEQIDVQFEGHTFKAPKEYDITLRTIYGDYMQFPPEEQRVPRHDSEYYWNSDQ